MECEAGRSVHGDAEMNLFEMLAKVKDLPEGDYAECGVHLGESALMIAERMNLDARLWLFDTFEGHGTPHEFDDAKAHYKGRYSDTSVEIVRKLIPTAQIIKGCVPESLAVVAALNFRFVHIDMDHYLPTKGACEFFKPRIVPGGIIRFDDYGVSDCPGATKAVDEIFGKEAIDPTDSRWENIEREA